MIEKSLFIVAEGKKDIDILKDLLDCSGYDKVYLIPAGGYGNITSYVKTIRLMSERPNWEDRIVAVFDSNSNDPDIVAEKKATMRYLTNASIDQRIGVFCFEPNLEDCLFGDNSEGKIISNLQTYVLEHKDEFINIPVIKEIQKFIGK